MSERVLFLAVRAFADPDARTPSLARIGSGAVDVGASFNHIISDFATWGGLAHGTNGNIDGNHSSDTLTIHTVLNAMLARKTPDKHKMSGLATGVDVLSRLQ